MAKRPEPDNGIRRAFGAAHVESSLFVLFVPSRDRFGVRIPQREWVTRALTILGRLHKGATAYPKGRGVWRDDERDGTLVFDEPVVIHCYTTMTEFLKHAGDVREFLILMGRECRQGAVGFVFDNDYFEINFALDR